MRARRPRLNGFSYKGRFQYFLTFCTAARQPTFKDKDAARAVTAQILQDAAAYCFAVPAYVLMPDHTHWLVEGLSDDSELCPFVKTAKQRTGYAFRRQTGRALWQPSFYDSVIRNDVQVWDVIRYIVNNPVRANLVASPADYDLWGSGTASRDEILRELETRPDRRWRPPG